MSRSLHLALPDWNGQLEDAHEATVAHLLHGPRYLQVAIELWKLAGQGERATQIWALLDLAYDRELKELYPSEMQQLEELLDGLDDVLKSSLLDAQWRVPPERMDEVRQRTTLLYLSDRAVNEGRDGVSAGLSEVHELRAFLRQGIERGLHLRLD